MAGRDMPEFAADEKSEFPLAQMIDVLARKHECVRIADADCGDRHEEVVADKYLRRSDVEFGRDRAHEPIDLGELASVDTDARTEQTPSADRDEEHAADDEQYEFGNRNARKRESHESDNDGRGEEARPEGALLARNAQ